MPVFRISTNFWVFFVKMMKNLFGLVLSWLLRIGYKVMKVNLNMPSIDHSDFNITVLLSLSLSFPFFVDWHHGWTSKLNSNYSDHKN